MGVVIQRGISTSFEYLFRPVKQYRIHESFIEIDEHKTCCLISFYSLNKIVLLKENLLIIKCVFWDFLFPKFDTFRPQALIAYKKPPPPRYYPYTALVAYKKAPPPTLSSIQKSSPATLSIDSKGGGFFVCYTCLWFRHVPGKFVCVRVLRPSQQRGHVEPVSL